MNPLTDTPSAHGQNARIDRLVQRKGAVRDVDGNFGRKRHLSLLAVNGERVVRHGNVHRFCLSEPAFAQARGDRIGQKEQQHIHVFVRFEVAVAGEAVADAPDVLFLFPRIVKSSDIDTFSTNTYPCIPFI